MTRLAEIEGHIASMGELLDVVGAMRSLAGMRVQEAQRALPGIRRYANAMADAIGDALLLMPEPSPRLGQSVRAARSCSSRPNTGSSADSIRRSSMVPMLLHVPTMTCSCWAAGGQL